MRRYKNQIIDIVKLAWPAIVQEALNVIIVYVDAAMVGSLGAAASASVGLTGTVIWLVSSICIALGMGVLAVCSQAYGAKNQEQLERSGQQAFFMTLVVGVVLMIACLLIGPYLPQILGADPSIQEDASMYFMIITAPMLFRAALLIFSCALRGVQDMKSPMIIDLLINGLNIVLNTLLIFPTRQFYGYTVFGFGWGVKGAAIATAITYTVGGCLMFMRYYNNKVFRFKETGFHYYKNEMQKCLHIGIPVVMERSVLCLGHIAFASLIAKLGVIPFAAHSLAIQAEQAFYIPGYGFQSAAATLSGQAVGQKNEKRIKEIAYLISGITAALMVFAGIMLFFFAENLMSIFTPDLEVIKLGASVLRIVALSEPIYGVLVILEGVFNGIGDTKAPFVFSLITMWGIRVFGSWILVNVFYMGLTEVWIMMVLDNVVRCFLLLKRFKKEKWVYLLSK